MDTCIWRLLNFAVLSPLRRQAEAKTTISPFYLASLLSALCLRLRLNDLSENVLFLQSSLTYWLFYSIMVLFFFLPSTLSATHIRTVLTGNYAPENKLLPAQWTGWVNLVAIWDVLSSIYDGKIYQFFLMLVIVDTLIKHSSQLFESLVKSIFWGWGKMRKLKRTSTVISKAWRKAPKTKPQLYLVNLFW